MIGILGVVFIAYFIFVNLIFGGTTFSWFYLLLGIVLFLYATYMKRLLEFDNVAKFVKPLRVLVIVGLIIFISLESIIVLYPKNKRQVSDYIVILGAGVRGENLTLTLRDRLDSALELANDINFKGKFLVTGGQGPGESITEAEAMRRYLDEQGIEENRILIEDNATSTYENFKYSKIIIENDSGKNIEDSNISVVTTDFHALRSNMLAKRNNYKDISIYTSKSEWYLIPSAYAREFFAFIKSLILDR